jgi:SAM-dependent methyltransferase
MITVDFRRINIHPGARILDVGCGSGRHTAAAYGLPRATAIGVDLCRADLFKACERLTFHDRVGASGGGVWALATADSLNLPFADSAFDLVICAEVLEHIADDGRALSELARVLKPGGDLVVSVPRAWPERICWRLAPDYSAANGGHVRIYRKKDLMAGLTAAGFMPRSAHHAHSLHSPYWWLKCLVGPQRTDCAAVNLYQRLLTWDIMAKPAITRLLDRMLNPLMGKSLVVYLRKPLV